MTPTFWPPRKNVFLFFVVITSRCEQGDARNREGLVSRDRVNTRRAMKHTNYNTLGYTSYLRGVFAIVKSSLLTTRAPLIRCTFRGKERHHHHHHHHHLSSSSREPHVRAAFIASPPDFRRVSGTRFISGARGGSEDAERGERPTLQDFPSLGHRARGHRGASLARAAVLNGHAREGLLDVHASPSPGGLLAGRTGGLVAHSRAGVV